jgi:hypothetical protein
MGFLVISHWDTWVGPKKSSLFSVRLYKNSDHKWVLAENFVNTLNGTNHVRELPGTAGVSAECYRFSIPQLSHLEV